MPGAMERLLPLLSLEDLFPRGKEKIGNHALVPPRGFPLVARMLLFVETWFLGVGKDFTRLSYWNIKHDFARR